MEKKKYKNLVTEARKDTVVATWGRFNPPTTGHLKLIKKLAAEANSRRADYRIYPTKSEDPKKNPLSFADKVKFMKRMFRKYARNISSDASVNTLIKAAQSLQKDGYKNLVLVVGGDRIQEFNTLLNKYNGKDFTFDSINVVSAGDRDPDAEGITGMSASKMRKAASSGDLGSFKMGVPSSFKDAEGLYNAVRKGMKIAEEVEQQQQQLDELSKKAKIAMGAAAVGLIALRRRKKKKKITTKEVDPKKEVPPPTMDRLMKGGIGGPRFNRLLRFGLAVGGIGDIPLTKRAFIDFDQSQTNPILRDKVFTTTDRLFDFVLNDKIIYNRLLLLLHKKTIFGESVMAQIDEAEGTTPLAAPYDNYPTNPNFVATFVNSTMAKSFIKDIIISKLGSVTWVSNNGTEVQFRLNRSIAGNEIGVGGRNPASKEEPKIDPDRQISAGADVRLVDIAMKYGGKVQKFEGDVREGIEFEDSDEIAPGLYEKSEKSGINYDILAEVYVRGLQSWEEDAADKDVTPEQWAFSRVNSFIAGGKAQKTCDSDLWEEHLECSTKTELDEAFETEFNEVYESTWKNISRAHPGKNFLRDIKKSYGKIDRTSIRIMGDAELERTYQKLYQEDPRKNNKILSLIRKELMQKRGLTHLSHDIGEEINKAFESFMIDEAKYKAPSFRQVPLYDKDAKVVGHVNMQTTSIGAAKKLKAKSAMKTGRTERYPVDGWVAKEEVEKIDEATTSAEKAEYKKLMTKWGDKPTTKVPWKTWRRIEKLGQKVRGGDVGPNMGTVGDMLRKSGKMKEEVIDEDIKSDGKALIRKIQTVKGLKSVSWTKSTVVGGQEQHWFNADKALREVIGIQPGEPGKDFQRKQKVVLDRVKKAVPGYKPVIRADKQFNTLSVVLVKEGIDENNKKVLKKVNMKAPVTDQDMSYLSDFHKEVYGFRPRGTYKHIKTVGDYYKEIKSLEREAESKRTEVKLRRIDRKLETQRERDVQKKRSFGPKKPSGKTAMSIAFKKAKKEEVETAEEHSAGDEGTKKVVNKYKKVTPGQKPQTPEAMKRYNKSPTSGPIALQRYYDEAAISPQQKVAADKKQRQAAVRKSSVQMKNRAQQNKQNFQQMRQSQKSVESQKRRMLKTKEIETRTAAQIEKGEIKSNQAAERQSVRDNAQKQREIVKINRQIQRDKAANKKAQESITMNDQFESFINQEK